MRQRDRIAEWVRNARAQRRAGVGAVCAYCRKERRPFALINGRIPPCCFACDRLRKRRPPYDRNHVFGRRNSPLEVRYPVSDHRAFFNVKQLDWTPETLENPRDSPLLGTIARFHGLDENVSQMLADCLAFAPRVKHVEDLLVTIYGPDWLPPLEAAARRARTRSRRKKPNHSSS